MTRNYLTSFLNQSFFQLLAKITSVGGNFVFFVLVSRFLGAEIFGQFSLIHSVLSTTVVICIVGLPLAGQRYVSKSSGQPDRQGFYVKKILVSYLYLFGLTGPLLYYSMPYVALLFDSPPIAEQTSLIVALLMTFGAWKIFKGIFKGYKEVQMNAIQGLLLGLGKILFFGFFYLLFEPSLEIALISFLAGYALVDLVYLVYLIYRLEGFGTGPSRDEPNDGTKTLWTYSLIIFMTNIVAVVLTETDRLMVGYFLPDRQVGYYSAALQWASLVLVLHNVLQPIAGSFISEFDSEDRPQAISSLYWTMTRISFLMMYPFAVVMALYPDWFLAFFGQKFTVAGGVLVGLTVAKTVHLMVGPSGIALVMTDLEAWDFALNLSLALINFWLNVLLIPVLGILGAALATMISWSALTVAKSIVFVWRNNLLSFLPSQDLAWTYMLISSFPFLWGASLYGTTAPAWIRVLVIFSLAGLCSLFFIAWTFNSEDRKALVNAVKGSL